MRYLLVAQSQNKYRNLEEYCMPLGIAYINGAMRKNGFNVEAINMLFSTNPLHSLKEIITEKKIDALVCGGLTAEYHVLKEIYEIARTANPYIIIIGGGGGFTSEPILFSQLTGVDYAIIGEGEITICELADALDNGKDVSKIKGLVYRQSDGNYFKTETRPCICNVDSIPFPSYEGLDMDKFLDYQNVDGWYNYYTYYSDEPRMISMVMARSCPFQCSFCFHPLGSQYRSRSLDNFFQELELWIEKYRINGVALIDECFSNDKNRVIEFCNRMKSYNLSWACQMRAETYTNEVLHAMKESGCIGACFGIESMSDKVLKNMNKHLDIETIERALKMTYKYQLGCTGNLIFGSEVEDFSTITESLSWNYYHSKKYNNHPVRQFSYVQTYPGSIFYKNANKKGIIHSQANYIENSNWNLNITNLSQENYDAMGDIIRLCRRENYNRGEIIAIIPTSRTKADFIFRCSYCGNINHYRNFNRSKFNEGKIKRLGCRHCNMLGDYVLDTESYLYDEYISIPWFLDIIDIKIELDYFIKRKWHNIGFCGMNAFSKKFISLILPYDSINVLFIYDYRLNPAINYGVPQICSLKNIPKVDVIINADMAYWKDMEKNISPYYDGDIIYLETLLRELYGKIENIYGKNNKKSSLQE